LPSVTVCKSDINKWNLGKPLKQLTHLLKSHLQTVGYDKTAVLCTHISSVNGRFALNCHMVSNQMVTQTDYYKL